MFVNFIPLLTGARSDLIVFDHSTAGQMFAGNCTTDVQFYDSEDNYNYKRAVTWSIVMAYLSHTHPAFETVFAIEAVNEPIQDATQTPGLGDCAFISAPPWKLR